MSRISMLEGERAAFLGAARTLRLASVDDHGWPVVTPLWYVWHDDAFWIWSLRTAKRTARLAEGGRASVLVDDGETYGELRGIMCRVEVDTFAFDDVPTAVNEAFARRYLPGATTLADRDDHVWMRLTPRSTRSWDFRKI